MEIATVRTEAVDGLNAKATGTGGGLTLGVHEEAGYSSFWFVQAKVANIATSAKSKVTFRLISPEGGDLLNLSRCASLPHSPDKGLRRADITTGHGEHLAAGEQIPSQRESAKRVLVAGAFQDFGKRAVGAAGQFGGKGRVRVVICAGFCYRQDGDNGSDDSEYFHFGRVNEVWQTASSDCERDGGVLESGCWWVWRRSGAFYILDKRSSVVCIAIDERTAYLLVLYSYLGDPVLNTGLVLNVGRSKLPLRFQLHRFGRIHLREL